MWHGFIFTPSKQNSPTLKQGGTGGGTSNGGLFGPFSWILFKNWSWSRMTKYHNLNFQVKGTNTNTSAYWTRLGKGACSGDNQWAFKWGLMLRSRTNGQKWSRLEQWLSKYVRWTSRLTSGGNWHQKCNFLGSTQIHWIRISGIETQESVWTNSPGDPYACSNLRCTNIAWGCKCSVLTLSATPWTPAKALSLSGL